MYDSHDRTAYFYEMILRFTDFNEYLIENEIIFETIVDLDFTTGDDK